jgi:hypothetical protein
MSSIAAYARAACDKFGKPLPRNEEEENVMRVYSAEMFQDLVVSAAAAEKEKQKVRVCMFSFLFCMCSLPRDE